MGVETDAGTVRQLLDSATAVFQWVWRVVTSLLVITAFVAVMYFTGARETFLWLNAMTWQETQCEIDAVYSGRRESGKSGSKSGSVSFKVSASYRYRNDYGRFVGSRYDFKGMFGSSYQSVQNDLHYLRNNARVPCYYNPRKPEQSVINRQFQIDSLIMLLPLFTLGLFAYMALCSLMRMLGIRRLVQPKKRGFLPWGWRRFLQHTREGA